MKLPVFTTKESFIEWHQREIEAIRNNGLRMAIEDYERAIRGESKEKWMKFNNTSDESVWEAHIDWLRDQVSYLQNKIKRYERKIAKCV